MRMARCLAEKLRGCGCRAYRDHSTSHENETALWMTGCRDRAERALDTATAKWLRNGGCQLRRLPQQLSSG